jgi:hypothetical protein
VSAADDEGRTAVYAAEEAAFGGTDLDGARSLDELVAAGTALVTGPWWRTAGGPDVRFAAARRDAASSSARVERAVRGSVEIRLAAGQRTTATLGHELAHALAGVARGHDATFRAAHVDVCALLGGGRAASMLAAAYAEGGVAPGARRWPSPVRVIGDGFVVVP